jgi:hypothetical protein
MTDTPPISGPHKFSHSNANVDQVNSQALVFIAERLAGIEWMLSQMNDKALKVQTTLVSIATVLPNLKLK